MKVNATLNQLLDEVGLVREYSPISQIEERISKRKSEGKPVTILYGETYDELGNPIDSLKYYLFAGRLAAVLSAQYECIVQPTILIADIAACRNFAEEKHPRLMDIGQKRYNFVQQVSDVYELALRPVLMSEFLENPTFQERYTHIRQLCLGNSELESWLEKTVPEDKVEIERAKGFQYALEEITTIIEIDIKVGPPREIFYDEPTRKIAQKLGYDPLLSIYLTPTLPLGLGFDYFLINQDIEQYGITAYKAGSKKLSEHRIVVGQTSPNEVERLLEKSFLPAKPKLPNPVLDIALITEMAQQCLARQIVPIDLARRFYAAELSASSLREQTIRHVNDMILDVLTPVQ